MSENTIALVTGANRGIGLEFIRQLAERGTEVIGTYRDEGTSAELLSMAEAKKNVHAVRADVTDEKAVKKTADFIADTFGRLDLLINNAGINIKYKEGLEAVRPDDLAENFRVNVVGPFMCASTLAELLGKSDNARLVNIGSQMGSISRTSGNAVPYRVSKTALNMLTKLQALNYEDKKILVLSLHPGWVQTDMGGKDATLTPRESVGSMLSVIDGMSSEHNGGFYSYTGDALEY